MSKSIQLQNDFLLQALTHRNLEDLLSLIVHKLPGLIWHGAFCSVFLWDNQRHLFILKATSNPDLRSSIDSVGYARGEGLTGWVGQQGKPLFLQNAKSEMELAQYADPYANIPAPQWKGKVLEGPNIACMLTPIGSGAETAPMGVIRLAPLNSDGQIPKEKHEELLSKLGNWVCSAIHEAQLKAYAVETMKSVQDLDMEGMLCRFIDYISLILKSFSSHIRVCDPKRNFWYTLGISTSPYNKAVASTKSSRAGYLIEPILAGQEEYHLDNDVQMRDRYKEDLADAYSSKPEYAQYLKEIGAGLLVPLRDQNTRQIIGMLNLHRFVGEKFDPVYDVSLAFELENFIVSFIMAIQSGDRRIGENALIDERERSLLYGEELFDSVLRCARRLTDCDVVLLRLSDETTGKQALKKCIGEYNGTIPPTRSLGEVGSGEAARTKSTVFISSTIVNSAYDAEKRRAKSTETEKFEFLDWIKSMIATPMIVSNTVVGTLIVLSNTPDKFGPRDINKMEGLAKEAAYRLYFGQLKRGFLERASHQLRTPLNTVKNLTEPVLREELGTLNADQKSKLAHVFDAALELEQLTDTLLDLAQIDARRHPLSLSTVDVKEIVKHSLIKVHSEVEKRKVQVNVSIDEQAWTILADEIGFTCILDNLISNAVKYANSGNGQVSVDLSCVRKKPTNLGAKGARGRGPWLKLVVEDNGDGIHRSYLHRIFNIFEQGHYTGSRVKKGTGLGLAYARGYAELHGGALWASSRGIGLGSCFTCIIPINAKQDV